MIEIIYRVSKLKSAQSKTLKTPSIMMYLDHRAATVDALKHSALVYKLFPLPNLNLNLISFNLFNITQLPKTST